MGLLSRFSGNSVVFDLISNQAKYLSRTADQLAKLFATPAHDRAEEQKALHAIENKADEANHTLLKKVNVSFVLPFDREDIYELAGQVDTCIDRMDEAGENLTYLKPGALPAEIDEMIDLLRACARRSTDILRKFKPTDPATKDYWIEINQLENQGDALYKKIIANLFDETTDPLEVLRIKLIVDALEGALDSFENLSSVVERISLKES
ncbi:DUF47 family protein [Actinotignum urinale]|uniref:DUF47 domain-containing protein n=1 Tax=Actinotignum urinale TaxID=190146 RepID=UPI002A83EFA4|nr:DUF47 family protein [Actinotignum urinale]MDY5151734.1 DUF47 family protein [Actinotignum urinale]